MADINLNVNVKTNVQYYYDIERMRTQAICSEMVKFATDFTAVHKSYDMKWAEVWHNGVLGAFPEFHIKYKNMLGFDDVRWVVTWYPDYEGFADGLLTLLELKDGKKTVRESKLTAGEVMSIIFKEGLGKR